MQYLMFVVGIVVPIILLTLFFKKKIYLSYNKYICSAIIAVLIALVLEVFTFNFNSFENTRSDKMTVSADIKTSEVINIFCFKVKILDILDHLLQTCCDREASSAWIDTIEHVEDNSLVGWVFEITLHHR